MAPFGTGTGSAPCAPLAKQHTHSKSPIGTVLPISSILQIPLLSCPLCPYISISPNQFFCGWDRGQHPGVRGNVDDSRSITGSHTCLISCYVRLTNSIQSNWKLETNIHIGGVIFNGVVGYIWFTAITVTVGCWSNMAVYPIVSGSDVIILVSVKSFSCMLFPSSRSSQRGSELWVHFPA